jgi:hypothetical protein
MGVCAKEDTQMFVLRVRPKNCSWKLAATLRKAVARAVGRGLQPLRLHRAPSRGGRQNGWSEKNIISQGQNVPPWASEGALFKHVAQGAKMPSYGPGCRMSFFDKKKTYSFAETGDSVVPPRRSHALASTATLRIKCHYAHL